MSSIFCNLILDHLNELLKDDFEIFKGHLMKNMADGFVPIQRSKLEKATRLKVTELMVDQYEPTQAANITVKILQRMGQNQLSSELEEKLKARGLEGQVQAAEVDGASSSSSSSSSSAAGVSQTISAEGASTVHAPVLSGGNYYGPVNINLNSTPK